MKKLTAALLSAACIPALCFSLSSSSVMAPAMADDTAGTSATSCKSEEHYPLISRDELAKHVDAKDAFIIDVNSKDSYQTNHVPGAIHYGSHKKDFAQQLPADKNSFIVAYCGGPMCTAWKQAAEKACSLGYTNIHHFKGGITGWVKGS